MKFKNYWKFVGFALLTTLVTVLPAQTGKGASEKGQSARGIYMEGSRLGVSTEIEVERSGQRMTVPADWEFKTGDRFWVHVTLNQDSYVYVLNRTLSGGPEQVSRGIKLLAEEDKKLSSPPPDTYTMVFPPPKAPAMLVKKGVRTSIPGNGQFFEMDQTLGAEKLIIVASPTPAEITKWFDASTGRLAASAKTNDSSDSALGRLNSELSSMADNTVTEPSKSRELDYNAGPERRPQSPPTSLPPGNPKAPVKRPAANPVKPPSSTVGVVKKPGKPMMVELTMMHQN